MIWQHFVRRLALAGLMALPTIAAGQTATGTVRGRVTDAASGRGIADAQVQVQDTRIGAITNANGEYTLLQVPAGPRVITVRRLGFQPMTQAATIAADATATVNFAVRESAVNLSEVVVTGSASPTEKRKIGTSIASVDSTAISKAYAVTVDQALQGRCRVRRSRRTPAVPAAVGFRCACAAPTRSLPDPTHCTSSMVSSSTTALRKLADLGGRSNPQNRLADLNPNDIERVEIIRGAAAAALYGSRANNGVVQIFTKRGAIGKPRFTFSTRYASNELREQQPFNFYPYDVNGLSVPRFNYQDDIFRRADTFENNLTVEGGNDQTRYFVSVNAASDDGIMKATSSQRRGARINLQQQLAPKLIANVTANYVATNNEQQAFGEQNDYGIMGSLFFAPTNVDFRPVNGIYPLPPALGTNPLLAIDRITNPQRISRFIGSTKLTWTPKPSLLFDYNIGIDTYGFEQDQFVPRNAVLGTAVLSTGRAQSVISNTRVVNQDGVGTWSYRLSDNLEARTTGGFNYTQQIVNTTNAVANGLAPVGELVGAGSVFSAGQSSIEMRTMGFYAQEEVAWNDRLFLTAAARYDASSTFAPSERWQLFPKFSASYVVTENRQGSFNNLRLRSALGWAGSQPGLVNAYSQYVGFTQLPFAGRPGFVNDITYGNPALKNERAREWEVGGDAGFLSGRVGLEATYYDRLVSDLLFFRPLPSSTGFSRQFYPIGTMSNKGFELMLHTVNLDKSNFKWESTVTYAHNKNLVESLDIQDFQSAGGYPNRIRAGEPAGVFYGSYAARDCNTGAFLLDSLGRYRRSNQTADMGTLEQRRAISGGTCNDSLNAVIGDPNPNWIGGFLNEFTIGKNLRFRVLLDACSGTMS
jgi:TonB-dependent SusC/RagA subfamily outer membrane receptor